MDGSGGLFVQSYPILENMRDRRSYSWRYLIAVPSKDCAHLQWTGDQPRGKESDCIQPLGQKAHY